MGPFETQGNYRRMLTVLIFRAGNEALSETAGRGAMVVETDASKDNSR
jgi:hypothetical protein